MASSSRRRGERHHYDSVSSDTEYSEPEEHRKGCIKRSKYAHCDTYLRFLFFPCSLLRSVWWTERLVTKITIVSSPN